MQVYLVLALVMALGIAVFVFQNTAMVTVHFITWVSPEISLAVVIILALFIGAVLTFLLDSVRYFKIAKRIKELTIINKNCEAEISKLKKQNEAYENERKKTEEG